MHDIRFIDEAFDIKKISGYHLSIQAGLDGFTYTIFDPSKFKYLVLKQYGYGDEIPEYKYPDILKKLLNEDEFLQKEFHSIYCIWKNPRTTLLPAVLFEKELDPFAHAFGHAPAARYHRRKICFYFARNRDAIIRSMV